MHGQFGQEYHMLCFLFFYLPARKIIVEDGSEYIMQHVQKPLCVWVCEREKERERESNSSLHKLQLFFPQ
jgi:hypothetical protein